MDDETGLVTLSISGRDAIVHRMRRAMAGEPQGAHITFPSSSSCGR